jgi:hypothetical protein
MTSFIDVARSVTMLTEAFLSFSKKNNGVRENKKIMENNVVSTGKRCEWVSTRKENANKADERRRDCVNTIHSGASTCSSRSILFFLASAS